MIYESQNPAVNVFPNGSSMNDGFGGGAQASPYGMQQGFDQASVMNGISGIQNSLANAEVSRCNAQATLLATLNANQNANTAAMNSLAMSLQNCCYEIFFDGGRSNRHR